MRQLVWFTEVHLRVTSPVGRRYVPQLTAGQTPGSDTDTEQSVHSAYLWFHRLSSRRPVDQCVEQRIRFPGGVSVQLHGVKPQRRSSKLHLPGAEWHAHRRWRSVVHPLQLYLRPGPLWLQKTSAIHQTACFRWDFFTAKHTVGYCTAHRGHSYYRLYAIRYVSAL